MKRLCLPFLLALLSVSMAVPACSVFSKCIAPELKNAEHATPQELGDEVALFLLCDPTFNAAQVPACAVAGLEQLAEALGPGGTATVDCIVAYWQTNGSATLQSRAKAMAVKRGLRASTACAPVVATYVSPEPDAHLDSTKTRGARLALPGANGNAGATASAVAHEPAGPPDGPAATFAYRGETVAHAAHACDARCGSRDAIGSPGGDCLCWRGPHDARGAWVAAR